MLAWLYRIVARDASKESSLCIVFPRRWCSELSRGGRLHGPGSVRRRRRRRLGEETEERLLLRIRLRRGERTLRAAALRLTPDSIALKPGPDPCTGPGGSLVGRSVEERRLGLVHRGRGRRGATDVERGKNQRGEGVLIRGERARRHPRRGDGASRRSGRGERGGGVESGGGGERRRLSGARGRRRRRRGRRGGGGRHLSLSLGGYRLGRGLRSLGCGLRSLGCGLRSLGASLRSLGASLRSLGLASLRSLGLASLRRLWLGLGLRLGLDGLGLRLGLDGLFGMLGLGNLGLDGDSASLRAGGVLLIHLRRFIVF